MNFATCRKCITMAQKPCTISTLTVEKGEFVFIVGSSGAGKSTFLKLVMCEERPNSGQIIVDGVDVTRIRKRKIPYIRRKMGIVFQDFRLIDHMTVYDNVAFAMRVVGASAPLHPQARPLYSQFGGIAAQGKALSHRAFRRRAPACGPGPGFGE